MLMEREKGDSWMLQLRPEDLMVLSRVRPIIGYTDITDTDTDTDNRYRYRYRLTDNHIGIGIGLI
jgi:hypothetical protein